MKPTVSRACLLATAILVAAALASAQDPCPSASGADAEAGWSAYGGDDMPLARRHFEAALSRCDNDHYSRTGLGYVELRDGNASAADRLWATVLEAEPSNVDALVGTGILRWRDGAVEQVRDIFSRVLQLSPEHPTAVDFLERVAQAEAGAQPSTDPADVAWREGRLDSAMELYRRRLAGDSQDLTAMLRVALMSAWQEQYSEAIALLDELIGIEPRHLDARLARARVRAWSGDLGRAQSEVAEILSVQPDNAEALEALALFQAWAGEFDASLASYDELVSIAPESGAAQLAQARAFAWASEFEASRAAYDALLEQNPDDIGARLGLARTLAFTQDFVGAVAQYDEVLARSPEDVSALLGKSKTLGWAGRLVESEETALRAVDVDPSDAAAWGSLAQVYRWQGRDPDALDALLVAEQLAPSSAEVRDQLRAVRLSFAPLVRPDVRYEEDSDGNRMVTTGLNGSWHPMPRLDLRAEAFVRRLEQPLPLGTLERTVRGLTVVGSYSLAPGWRVTAGLGGTSSDAPANSRFMSYRLGVRSPERTPISWGLTLSGGGLTETAVLAERGISSWDMVASGRWIPAQGWRVDANLGLGAYNGVESNGRRSAYLGASRRIGRFFSLGASFRGFSFEKDLFEGYFDPDFYGIWEATSYWLYRPGPWLFLVEMAPGLQKVTTSGSLGTSLRTNGRVGYRFAPGRELSLTLSYSTAGLMPFATGATGYNYTGVRLGSNWVF